MTNLGLVAHQPFGDGVHRVEDEQLSNSYSRLQQQFLHILTLRGAYRRCQNQGYGQLPSPFR